MKCVHSMSESETMRVREIEKPEGRYIGFDSRLDIWKIPLQQEKRFEDYCSEYF